MIMNLQPSHLVVEYCRCYHSWMRLLNSKRRWLSVTY